MANGTTRREIARADRIRERQEQDQRATRNAIDGLSRTAPGTQPYREEMESISEITAGATGLHARGIPREAWTWIGVGIALFIGLAGVALVVALL